MLATLSWLKTLVSRHEAVTSGGGRIEAVFFSPKVQYIREIYRRRLRESKKNPVETYRQLATRILDLTNQWTKEYTTGEQLQQLIADEQIQNTLPADIQVWIQERKSKTTAEAGRRAEDYWQARDSVKSGKRLETSGWRMGSVQRKCFECRQPGYIAKGV